MNRIAAIVVAAFALFSWAMPQAADASPGDQRNLAPWEHASWSPDYCAVGLGHIERYASNGDVFYIDNVSQSFQRYGASNCGDIAYYYDNRVTGGI